MGLGSSLLGIAGTVIGGPLGGAIGGALGGALGGGSRAAPPGAAMQPTASPLSQHLMQQAFARSLREELAQPSVYSATEAMAGGPPQLSGGMSQLANQRGGMGYPYSAYRGTGLGGGAGGDSNEGRGAGGPFSRRGQQTAQQQTTPTAPTATETAYDELMLRALQGYGGLPRPMYEAEVGRGLAGIGAQSQVMQQGLATQLGRRGLLRSGIYGQGLGDIMQARMGATSQLLGGLGQQQQRAAQQAQMGMAGMFMTQEEGAKQRALSLAMQRKQIAAAEPEWWEPFAALGGAYYQGEALKDLYGQGQNVYGWPAGSGMPNPGRYF